MASRLVTVGTYWVLAEAHLARTALALEGIQGFLRNEYLCNLGEASQPIMLQVRYEHRVKAIEILKRREQDGRTSA